MADLSEQLAEFRDGAWRIFTGQTDFQQQSQEMADRSQTRATELSERAASKTREAVNIGRVTSTELTADEIRQLIEVKNQGDTRALENLAQSLRAKYPAQRGYISAVERTGKLPKGADPLPDLVPAPPAEPTTEEAAAGLAESQRQARGSEMSARERGFEIMPEMQITAGSGANNPIEASPAVRAAKASTATNRGILPGGETVEDEEGWSYKRFDDGSIQIVTAPDSNKSAIGMMLTDKSTGDNAEYYEAISGFMKRKLDTPLADADMQMEDGKELADLTFKDSADSARITGTERDGTERDGKMVAVDRQDKAESEASPAEANAVSRNMGKAAPQDERKKKAKEIAGRFLKNRRGLLMDEGEDGQTETIGDQ